jgi:hypothetical protein
MQLMALHTVPCDAEKYVVLEPLRTRLSDPEEASDFLTFELSEVKPEFVALEQCFSTAGRRTDTGSRQVLQDRKTFRRFPSKTVETR